MQTKTRKRYPSGIFPENNAAQIRNPIGPAMDKEAVQRFLDSDGNRHAIGDLDELHEAVDCLEAYQDFQPDRFERRELNRQLRTLAQDREVRL